MDDKPAEIVLIDDDSSFLKALERQVRLMGHVPVTFGDAEAGLHHIRNGQSDCLLVDLRMPGVSGLDVQDVLAELPVPIVFISGQATIPATVQAMRNGAVTFLEKPVEYEDVRQAIGEALRYGAELKVEHAGRAAATRRFDQLTARQKDVLRLVVTGVPNKVIARKLGIGERTVKAHRQAIMERLQATSVADLYHLAADLGIDPDDRG